MDQIFLVVEIESREEKSLPGGGKDRRAFSQKLGQPEGKVVGPVFFLLHESCVSRHLMGRSQNADHARSPELDKSPFFLEDRSGNPDRFPVDGNLGIGPGCSEGERGRFGHFLIFCFREKRSGAIEIERKSASKNLRQSRIWSVCWSSSPKPKNCDMKMPLRKEHTPGCIHTSPPSSFHH